jgi:mono/diheme cytochrome c family protein
MEQNGGATTVAKDAEGRYTPGTGAAAETCIVCHGPGALGDIAKVHNIVAPGP